MLACTPSPPKPAGQKPAEPQIRATVVTIQTTLVSGKGPARNFTHSLVIAGDRARSGDEVDSWRLYDLKNNKVTFVDDIARTFRTQPLQSLLDVHRHEMAEAVSPSMPHAQFAATGAKRVIAGVNASENVIRLGGYQRNLWIAEHPQIPPQLFTMMIISQPVSSPLTGVMRAADDALLKTRGFPMADHSELPYGNTKMVIDRNVVKVEQ